MMIGFSLLDVLPNLMYGMHIVRHFYDINSFNEVQVRLTTILLSWI